jgi:hypothetical protein
VTKEQEIAYTENKFADVFMIYHRKAWQHEHVYKLTQIGWKYLVLQTFVLHTARCTIMRYWRKSSWNMVIRACSVAHQLPTSQISDEKLPQTLEI